MNSEALRPPRRLRTLAAITLVLVGLLMTACAGGGDDDEPQPTSEPTATTRPAPTSSPTTVPAGPEPSGTTPTPTSPPSTPTGVPSTPTPTAAATVGSVDIRVTDQADGTITAIVITATDIQVHAATGADDVWLTVLEGEYQFDLLKVVGMEESLGVTELAPGRYTQIRLSILEVTITRGGEDIVAEVPSSVLRVVRPFDVVAGETTVLTFDFDADRSVVSAGPRLLLKPVVKLLVRKADEPFVPEANGGSGNDSGGDSGGSQGSGGNPNN